MASDAKDAAIKFCTFFEKSLADIPPVLIVMLTDFAELGEEQAQENFMANLEQMSPQEQQELMAELPKLEKFSTDMDSFFENDMKQYEIYQDNDEFPQLMMKEVNSIPNCELPQLILKVALEELDEESEY